MGLTNKDWWYVGGALVGLYLVQKYRINSQISDPSLGGLGLEGALAAMGTANIDVKLTRYYAYDADGNPTAAGGIEGGSNDRLGKPLYSLDQFNRGEAEYVSLSGDDRAFPYGQKVTIDAFPGVVFRIVDTGGSFSSASKMYSLVRKVPLMIAGAVITTYGKLYRMAGYEPIDVCSDPGGTKVPNTAVMTIYAGDDFASQNPSGLQSLDYSKLRTDVTGQVPQGSSGDSQVPTGGDEYASNDWSGVDEFGDPEGVA